MDWLKYIFTSKAFSHIVVAVCFGAICIEGTYKITNYMNQRASETEQTKVALLKNTEEHKLIYAQGKKINIKMDSLEKDNAIFKKAILQSAKNDQSLAKALLDLSGSIKLNQKQNREMLLQILPLLNVYEPKSINAFGAIDTMKKKIQNFYLVNSKLSDIKKIE